MNTRETDDKSLPMVEAKFNVNLILFSSEGVE
jgi:hypothetical protein